MCAASNEVVQLLSDLVRIESVTPWLVPGGAGESAIVAHLASLLDHPGIDIQVEEVQPGRPNLIATVRGAGHGPTLCLNAHADTVGYENWRDEALTPRVDGDRLYGLGACDDKAGCAAMVLTLLALAADPPERGTFMAAFVADEEALSVGTEHLVKRAGIDAAIVIEPHGLDEIVVAHQGFGWIDITTHGVAAHGSAPEQGVDSIAHMSEVMAGLRALDRDVYATTSDLPCGKTVFHASTIGGGTDYATYPSRTTLGIEIGTQPGEKLANRVAEIQAIFAAVATREPAFRGEITVQLERDPFTSAGHERLLSHLNAAFEAFHGRVPVEVGLNAWTDAALLQSAGIPTVLIGPSGGNLHAPGEWVSIPELTQLCSILESTARTFLA
ncbi:MAG TPA: M20/M25/M40 family metallo-hydrolase [Streptosporangiaceae bacterium]|nr:M20/M25/M40 family metallo-hydrolase [Streptosporangiaceae bacterium]